MAIRKTQHNADDSRSDIAQQDEERMVYLLECFRAAKQELLLRFKYRENWLQLQLLSQVVLVALSQGIEIAGIKTIGSIPDILALSTAVSGVFASLYYIDDSLISYIGNYLGAVTDAEAKLRSSKWRILNWDSSDQVKHYVSNALPIRYLTQLIAFGIIPTGLVAWRMFHFPAWGAFQISELVSHIVFLSFIGYVIFRGFRRRRDSFLGSRQTILKPIEPTTRQP